MSTRRVVERALGREMSQQRGGPGIVHPVVGIGARHTVLAVFERVADRVRGSRHGRQSSPGRVIAAGSLFACAALAGLSLQAPAASAADDDTTFTVALLNEVDSFNPFLGIEAESFEMWALTYDYMIGYSMEDMSPEPGLATSWDTSDDGLTWTFDIRSGVTWSDGEPLTATDIAYTYDRILDGNTESATWGSYLKGVTSVTAPDATTVVLELKKPNSVLPLLPIPIVPEHIWKDVSEKDVKSYGAEPTDGQPVVGSGPFRLVEGTAGGSTYRFEVNPDYWKGTPHISEVDFRVFKSEDPAVQALLKGEVDFVEGISALQVKSLQGEPGITAQNGDSPGFDEISFNVGSVDLETDEPMGDPNPAVLDPKFRHALGFGLNLDQLISTVYQGAGLPGDTIIPPGYEDYHWSPPDDVAFTYDPEKAAELLDEAGYQVGADGFRTLPDGTPIGKLRLLARSDSSTSTDTMAYFKEWLADLDIDSEVSAVESSKLTSVILDGTFDAFQWGWYVEPDPDSMLSYMTCGQRGNWSDSWFCDPAYDALYDQQHTELDDAARSDEVQQMQQILFEQSPYLVTAYNTVGEAVRSDRFACFEPQPDPGGILLFQYGVHNYLNMRPAAEAGDCDGVSSAVDATRAAEDSSVGPGFLIGLALAVGAAVVVGGVLVGRRRASVGDRE